MLTLSSRPIARRKVTLPLLLHTYVHTSAYVRVYVNIETSASRGPLIVVFSFLCYLPRLLALLQAYSQAHCLRLALALRPHTRVPFKASYTFFGKKNKKIENFFLVMLRTPQRIRRFACLQDCLLTLTCHLAWSMWMVVC